MPNPSQAEAAGASQDEQLAAILGTQPRARDALLPVLHQIQDTLGYIPPATLPEIARAFHLSRAEVHGVVTFYHHFRSAPPARHTIALCRAEACQSMGADALLAHAEKALGCAMHKHSADGEFALEPVYCLGQCATSPAMMLDGAVHARVTPQVFDRLVARAKEV